MELRMLYMNVDVEMDSVRNTRTSPRCGVVVLRVARRCTRFPPKPGATLSPLARVPGTVEEIRTGHYGGKRCQTLEKIIFLFVTCCFVPGTLGGQANAPSAKIEGTVFVRDSA